MNERAHFEEFAKSSSMSTWHRRRDGCYLDPMTEAAWQAWRQRAILAGAKDVDAPIPIGNPAK